MISTIILAATLLQNCVAVSNAAVAIDAAIVAKGGTTEGGLNNAAAAIAALPSGGDIVYAVTNGVDVLDSSIMHLIAGDTSALANKGIVTLSSDFATYLGNNLFVGGGGTLDVAGDFPLLTATGDFSFQSSNISKFISTSPYLTEKALRGQVFWACSNLQIVDIPNAIAANNNFLLGPNNALSVYITNRVYTADAYPNLPWGASNAGTKFYFSNGHVEKVGDTWTFISD